MITRLVEGICLDSVDEVENLGHLKILGENLEKFLFCDKKKDIFYAILIIEINLNDVGRGSWTSFLVIFKRSL